MKIALDGQKLLIEKLAGPEVYTYSVYKALAQIDNDNDYVIYFDREPKVSFWEDISANNTKFSYTVLPYRLSWTQFSLPLQLIKDRPDVFFNAKHTIPFFRTFNTAFVSMIHGLEYKTNRQYFDNVMKYGIHPIILWWVLRFSKVVVVPSDATKKAIADKKWPGIDLAKIRIIPEGVKDGYYRRPSDEINPVREKYKVGKNPYILFISTIQPRKNIPRMVHAFSNVVKNYKNHKDLKLLISGKLGWLYTDSLRAPGKYEIAENIRFIGRTSDEDSAKLLSGAEAHVNFSLEEGFGLPLLEAMACETPSVVSDIPAYRELGQDAVIFTDPFSVTKIEQGILECLNTDQKEKVKKGKELSKQYSWEKCARKILDTFMEACR